MASTAKLTGLPFKAATPNLDALQDFLWVRIRYGYDDVPHPDLFDLTEWCDEAQWAGLGMGET
jgi:hypothetical protein